MKKKNIVIAVLLFILLLANVSYAAMPDVLKSVVRIKVEIKVKAEDSLHKGKIKTKTYYASGTGVVIAPGQILTCYHIVTEDNQKNTTIGKIEVIAHDLKKYEAKIIKTNKYRDLALLEIKADLPPLKFGEPRVGDTVFLIGQRDLYGLVVTGGIIAHIDNKLHTDCSLSAGNSGGPIVNEKGEIVGLIRAVDYRPMMHPAFFGPLGECVHPRIIKKFLKKRNKN